MPCWHAFKPCSAASYGRIVVAPLAWATVRGLLKMHDEVIDRIDRPVRICMRRILKWKVGSAAYKETGLQLRKRCYYLGMLPGFNLLVNIYTPLGVKMYQAIAQL